MTEQPEAHGEAERITSLQELHARQERQEGMLQKIIDMLTGTGKPAPPAAGDGPADIAAQVREELARQDQAARADADKAEYEGLKATVAKLTEKVPEAPERAVTRLMYGSRHS